MKRFLLILLFWAHAASGQAVVVKSGDHDGFTRLVLELASPIDWQFGRTEDGYALRIAERSQPFDLSQVFRLIGTQRLAAIWADPENGDLRLGIGCYCHAIPFEFRPGVIVIDLRDGPPPDGSSFETALDGPSMPTTNQRKGPRPRPRPPLTDNDYDWRTVAASEEADNLPLMVSDPALAAIRQDLIAEIGRSASTGVVDIVEALPPPGTSRPGPLAQVRIGDARGFGFRLADEERADLTAQGDPCLADSQLDIAAWGTDEPAARQMASVFSGLLGEFDEPNPEAVVEAVKLYLHLGFGSEATRLIDIFPVALPDKVVWRAMAEILDDGHTDSDVFAEMGGCESAAALWALLASADPTHPVQPTAVQRTFSGLPLHLRIHFGPLLADRFLERGDAPSARAIRDAILRVDLATEPAVSLMEARIDLAQGEVERADETLGRLVDESSPATTEALIDWVDRAITEGNTIDPKTALTLAALVHEHRGAPLEVPLRRAQILALAASGDYDSAFDLSAKAPAAEADLWAQLAKAGPDSALLSHAVLPENAQLPMSSGETHRLLAQRLIGLGFADQGLAWIGSPPTGPTGTAPDLRLLAARAELIRRDSRAALRLLAGLDGAEASQLRAQALEKLGNLQEAAAAYADAGDEQARLRLARLAQDWAQVAAESADPWRKAAQLVRSPEDGSVDLGPLAKGQMVVAESAEMRSAMNALLSGVTPSAP